MSMIAKPPLFAERLTAAFAQSTKDALARAEMAGIVPSGIDVPASEVPVHPTKKATAKRRTVRKVKVAAPSTVAKKAASKRAKPVASKRKPKAVAKTPASRAKRA
jgi:hypothetical protein